MFFAFVKDIYHNRVIDCNTFATSLPITLVHNDTGYITAEASNGLFILLLTPLAKILRKLIRR